jgi:hypothetical protein
MATAPFIDMGGSAVRAAEPSWDLLMAWWQRAADWTA